MGKAASVPSQQVGAAGLMDSKLPIPSAFPPNPTALTQVSQLLPKGSASTFGQAGPAEN